ncbi:hypothetical protein BY996DRAFT_8396642 [Phakopsora pachyrhizi]|nr:hypothetical protein BY996DRAFT_8396642 [Phakopsora pachyrhizi]
MSYHSKARSPRLEKNCQRYGRLKADRIRTIIETESEEIQVKNCTGGKGAGPEKDSNRCQRIEPEEEGSQTHGSDQAAEDPVTSHITKSLMLERRLENLEIMERIKGNIESDNQGKETESLNGSGIGKRDNRMELSGGWSSLENHFEQESSSRAEHPKWISIAKTAQWDNDKIKRSIQSKKKDPNSKTNHHDDNPDRARIEIKQAGLENQIARTEAARYGYGRRRPGFVLAQSGDWSATNKGFRGLRQDKDSTKIKGQKSRRYRIKRLRTIRKKSRAVEQDRKAENSGKESIGVKKSPTKARSFISLNNKSIIKE